jgi:hypothetical protein
MISNAVLMSSQSMDIDRVVGSGFLRFPAAASWGGPQSPELLAHQQFYYDVGFVVARVVARELMSLRAGGEGELAAAVWNTVQLHFIFRAGLIQRRYDLDTRHGAIRYDQQLWTWRMSACLADPTSSQIGGFWL